MIFGFCGIAGCLGVMLAALGAHLPDTAFIPGGRPMLSRAVEMLMWHVIALLALGVSGAAPLRWIALPMASGTVLFVGSVVSLALQGPNVAFLAPIGGMLTMAAWLGLTVMAVFAQRRMRAAK